jgi:hypothetical protein
MLDIVNRMRLALGTTVLVLGLFTAGIASGAAVSAKGPTQKQISSAVRRAERSKSLWATVNLCHNGSKKDRVGIRGQMPALGFAAWLSMDVKINYYSTSEKRFVPDPNTKKLVRLGRWSTGLEQQGAVFTFHAGQSYLVNASVTFIWRRSGSLLGETTRTTTTLTAKTQFRPHYSAEQCRIH